MGHQKQAECSGDPDWSPSHSVRGAPHVCLLQCLRLPDVAAPVPEALASTLLRAACHSQGLIHSLYASIMMFLRTQKLSNLSCLLSLPVAAASSRTAIRFRNASEESCLTSSLPPCKPPTTTTAATTVPTAATMKRLLTQPVEEYVVKWLHYGPQPDERWALLPSHQAPAAGLIPSILQPQHACCGMRLGQQPTPCALRRS